LNFLIKKKLKTKHFPRKSFLKYKFKLLQLNFVLETFSYSSIRIIKPYISNSLWIFVCNIQNFGTISKGNNFIFQISNHYGFLYAIFIIPRQFQRYYVISFEKGFEGQRPKVKPHNHRCSICLIIFYVFRLF
jgi:hypothetical protein